MRHNTYRIERVLGQGGFGITYLATDINLDRHVAIKEFFPKDYCDREASTSHVTLGTQSAHEFVNKLKAKFLKEARNIAKFDNPGIIKIYAAFEENNTAYYVMDYIDGMSLSEMVKRNGPLPESRALGYICKVGRALEYVHAQKINHLDIKPANIMVRKSDDMPILIDFGLSKQYDTEGNQTSTTPTGISHGYAPMEQYNDGGVREFSPQTDIYSLAATLYYILSGVTPPQSTKLVEDELTFPGAIPIRLIPAISKAMSPMRKKRHKTVGEFVGDIQKCEAPDVATVIKPESSKPAAPPKPKPRASRAKKQRIDDEPESNKGKYIGIAAAIVVLVAVVVGVNRCASSGIQSAADSLTVDSIAVVAEEDIQYVKDMYWKSPLGGAVYTGTVVPDSVVGSDKLLPHGKGMAKIIDGQYKDNVYKGDFYYGKMEGDATYTNSDDDVFKGKFKDNRFLTGRYTNKSTGEYFEGDFDKYGQPANGKWYDKNGKEIQ